LRGKPLDHSRPVGPVILDKEIFHMKKTLKLFMVMFLAIALGSFLITSCDSPTNGDTGATGARGAATNYIESGAVSATSLSDRFYAADVITLGSGVTSVEGEVPAGKRLIVSGANTYVLGASSLEVIGTLEIRKDAALNASYISGSNGYLEGTGSITGAGSVYLPYLTGSNAGLPQGGIHYASTNIGAVKAVGSYKNTPSSTTTSTALTSAIIGDIFGATNGPTTLAAANVTGLTDVAVPSGKTLTLIGNNNTVVAPLSLASKGTLIVAEGAILETTSNITADGTTPITIKGTLRLASSVTALTLAGKVDLSDGRVSATSLAAPATLTLPSGDATIRRIEVGNTYDLTIAGATGLIIDRIDSSGAFVTSGSVTKYTVAGSNAADFVQLGVAATAFAISDLDDGVFVIKAATLATNLTLGGAAKLDLGAGLTIPSSNFALTTVNLAKLVSGSDITFTGTETGAAEILKIPEGVAVTTAGTLATVTGIEIADSGSLTANAAGVFTATASITIADNGYLVVGATFAPTTASLGTEGEGVIYTTAGAALTKILTLTPASKFTVGISGVNLSATTAIPANVTIGIFGTTDIAGAAAITISGGDGIFVDGSGTLNVTAGDAGGSAGTAVTVSTPVTVAAGGSLVVKGGGGATTFAGGMATVETVIAQAGSTIAVTAGVGASASGTGIGGKAVIGSASEATKKITFDSEGTTITVGITSGAAANAGNGGAAELYTSNVVSNSYGGPSDTDVIEGVTLTITGGAADGGGQAGTGTISDTNKSIVVTGGTHS
jgi:hypothetical protein